MSASKARIGGWEDGWDARSRPGRAQRGRPRIKATRLHAGCSSVSVVGRRECNECVVGRGMVHMRAWCQVSELVLECGCLSAIVVGALWVCVEACDL